MTSPDLYDCVNICYISLNFYLVDIKNSSKYALHIFTNSVLNIGNYVDFTYTKLVDRSIKSNKVTVQLKYSQLKIKLNKAIFNKTKLKK